MEQRASRVLVAVDRSEESERAVRHLAARLGSLRDPRVRLLHVIGPLPPATLETRGSNDPAEEERQSAALDEAQLRWTREHAREPLAALEPLRRVLIEAGLPAERVELAARAMRPEESVTDVLLDEASSRGCDTLVVGASPGRGDLFSRRSTGDKVAGRARDELAVWVVR